MYNEAPRVREKIVQNVSYKVDGGAKESLKYCPQNTAVIFVKFSSEAPGLHECQPYLFRDSHGF